ncbi:hypothetical protein EV199_1678 [Pseudobacter ginsenosidimutans]|uniref:Uncharacterized protein n=1 Tax=Pseudobacter ginsenosidimutans TaxID=661488 RepID=A0A4Q7N476_9BACT|nr:hypothetical protein EV199_1678 [Pseudobacter ginsenosidimutans]
MIIRKGKYPVTILKLSILINFVGIRAMVCKPANNMIINHTAIVFTNPFEQIEIKWLGVSLVFHPTKVIFIFIVSPPV